MRTPIRSTVCAISTVLVLGAATACEPPPPPPVLVVTTTAVGPDSSPGDGICEMTPDAGDCSLEAALQEGNALGRAAVSLADSGYSVPAVTITGEISVTGVRPVLGAPGTTLSGGPIDVGADGRLVLDTLTMNGGGMSVDGVLDVRRSYLFWTQGLMPSIPTVDVNVGGTALFQNTILPGYTSAAPALHNSGVVVLHHTTVFASPTGGQALHNEGVVHSVASYRASCSGTPLVSYGYNAGPAATCGLDDPTDVASPTGLMINGSPRWYFFMYTLSASSPMTDAVPAGVHGCGTTVTDDLLLRARPFDGDGDGTAACDIGALEEAPYVP